MGYKIVIITARPGIGPVIKWTIKQLGEYGIGFDYLGFTSASTKTKMKKQLPYNFILSVGDLPTDLTDSPHFLNISNFDHNWNNWRTLSSVHQLISFAFDNTLSSQIYSDHIWRNHLDSWFLSHYILFVIPYGFVLPSVSHIVHLDIIVLVAYQ